MSKHRKEPVKNPSVGLWVGSGEKAVGGMFGDIAIHHGRPCPTSCSLRGRPTFRLCSGPHTPVLTPAAVWHQPALLSPPAWHSKVLERS